jgi:hypothetical protein
LEIVKFIDVKNREVRTLKAWEFAEDLNERLDERPGQVQSIGLNGRLNEFVQFEPLKPDEPDLLADARCLLGFRGSPSG